jgi:hypothetical protein
MHKEKNTALIAFLVCLTALISPLVLIPIEKAVPYPYIVEELFKAILIFYVIKLFDETIQTKLALLAGFLFSLSENVFYLANFISNGLYYSTFWQRSLLTTSLHLLTMTIILLPSQKRIYCIIPATIVAIIIHFLYNQTVLSLF